MTNMSAALRSAFQNRPALLHAGSKTAFVVLDLLLSDFRQATRMKILLLSMPDSFEHMPEPVIRMPNGALTSLAGNIDPHHSVGVADLILVQRRVRQTVE